MNKRKLQQAAGFSFIYACLGFVIISLVVIIGFIAINGLKVISWEFLTQGPKNGMSEGGIFPAILGTFLLSTGAIFFALPLGLLTAIWLTEYNSGHRGFIRVIRVAVDSLAGVPSIVFGLFGLAFFVKFMGFGVSILSGSLVLGILILPTIIRTAEEAILSVPKTFKEASLALGATQWQTAYKIILPNALPGILTGVILSIGRAAGETAPILMTAATFFTMRLPNSLFSEVMALPYHIYALMTEGTSPKQLGIAYGTALVLLVLVLIINSIAIIIRNKIKKDRKW